MRFRREGRELAAAASKTRHLVAKFTIMPGRMLQIGEPAPWFEILASIGIAGIVSDRTLINHRIGKLNVMGCRGRA